MDSSDRIRIWIPKVLAPGLSICTVQLDKKHIDIQRSKHRDIALLLLHETIQS